jgi:hypothetical protein
MQLKLNVSFFINLLFLLAAGVAHAQLASDMRLFSDSFVSPAFESDQKTNYQFVGATLNSPAGTDDIFRMNAEGALAFGAPSLNYLNISEFYAEFTTLREPGQRDSLALGRKLVKWSDLDQRWDLGLWQPLFQWNPLAPQQQGLPGIFWQTEREHYAFTLFASYLFLPNQGPSYEVRNGTFVPSNPWFRSPPESVKIFGESTVVDYNVQTPSQSDVIYRTSYGAKLNLGSEETVAVQLSHMYKPSNELALGYAGVLNTSTLHGEVTVKPQVFNHSISALDLSHRTGNFHYGIGTLFDRPDKDIPLEAQWTRAEYADAVLYSPFVEWEQPGYRLALAALKVTGGEVTETGDLASTKRAPLGLRYPFQEAVRASVENDFAFLGFRRWLGKLAYTYSDKNKFEYIQWQTKFRWTRLWTLFSEVELVHADDTSFENQNEIAQYRNLDRFLIGAAYVF